MLKTAARVRGSKTFQTLLVEKGSQVNQSIQRKECYSEEREGKGGDETFQLIDDLIVRKLKNDEQVRRGTQDLGKEMRRCLTAHQ